MNYKFWGFLFCFFLVGGGYSASTYAKLNMLIDWQYDESNELMNFTIRQAYYFGDDYRMTCSIMSPCTIAMTYSANLGYPWKYKIKVYGVSLPMSDIVYSLNKDLPVSGSMPVVNASNICYMVAMLRGDNSERGYYLGSTCDGSINPPEPPKPQVSCYMDGNIYLRHGSITDSEVAGNRAESTAYVYCTGDAKVKVRALSSVGSDSYMVNLRADGSLKSLLSVNGTAGNGGITLEVPGTRGAAVTFSSLLIPSGTPTPGDFSGSAVAV